jgi:predicted small secreted protein
MRAHRTAFNLTQLAILVALAAWLMAGCATVTGFVVTGESLDSVGKAFVTVGQTYNRELDAKRVTPEQYRDWAVFARKFQQAYPSSVQLWKSAVAVNDAALTKKTNEIITSLVTELSRLGSVVGVQVLGGT